MSDATDRPSRAELNEPGLWLGHYTTAAAAFEHIIPTGQLRMSPYHRMRDPAENKGFFPSASPPRDSENPVQDWLAAGLALKEARDQMRLMSLTCDAPDYDPAARVFGCCWARARLWEQYADVHHGVCLVFDRALFEEAVRDELGEDCVSFGEVEYTPMGVAESAATHISDQRLMNPATREQAVSASPTGERNSFSSSQTIGRQSMSFGLCSLGAMTNTPLLVTAKRSGP